jgi:hypothetical protein
MRGEIMSRIGKLTLTSIVIGFVLLAFGLQTQAQTTTIAYDSRLTGVYALFTGQTDMRFRLYGSLEGGTQIGDTVSVSDVQVLVGTFTVQLNFGANAFPGANRFIEIDVKRLVGTGYVTLTPRQPLTSVPYAVRALSAASADSFSGNCLLCVTDANIISVSGSKVIGPVANATNATNAVNATNAQNAVNAQNSQKLGGINANQYLLVNGDGSHLTNVNATVADGSITTPKMADASVTEAKLSDNAVTGPKIADGSVTTAKLAPGVIPTATNPYDPQQLGMLRWDLLPTGKTIQVGGAPSALGFDGTFIYVVNEGNSVSRIRASTGSVEGSPIIVDEASPFALAYDGTFMYVLGGNFVRRIRASTGLVEGSPIPVGTFPMALAFDGTFIYVANRDSDDVTRIRASTGLVEGPPITVGDRPQALAFDGTFIYVANTGTGGSGGDISRIRASTGLVEGSPILTAGHPSALAFDGTFIYSADRTFNYVLRIRASSGLVEGSLIMVDHPGALAFDGTFMYVANLAANNVTRIRASTGLVEGSPIPVGGFLGTIAFDGSFVYVSKAQDGTVTRFRP